MVREFTELQGTMGGIYARAEQKPEAIWKAIYYHYLPSAWPLMHRRPRKQLGGAAVTWAAVSLADKLDSVIGMFSAGERPTGSRDPLGLRRQAQGAVKILADLPELTGQTPRMSIGRSARRVRPGLRVRAGRAVARQRCTRSFASAWHISFRREDSTSGTSVRCCMSGRRSTCWNPG